MKPRQLRPRIVGLFGVFACAWLLLGLSGCGSERKIADADGLVYDAVVAGVEVDGKWGFIDRSGQFVLPPTLRNSLLFPYFSEGMLAVSTDDLPASGIAPGAQLYGYIDLRGHYVIAPRFELALPFCNHLAACMMNGKWGFIDSSGTFVIPPKFASTSGYFVEGKCAVAVQDTFGYVDDHGNWLIQPKYSAAGFFADGLAPVAVGKGDKQLWGYIDAKGQEAIAPKFKAAQPFYGEWAVAQDAASGKWGYIDRKGNWALPADFDYARAFVGPVAVVAKRVSAAVTDPCELSFYLIDKKGAPGWASRYSLLYDFSVATNGLLPARTKLAGGESGTSEAVVWGYIDVNSGKWAIEPQFALAGAFSYGLAKAYKSGQAGFLDAKGKWVINAQYTNATDFHNTDRNYLLDLRLLEQHPCFGYY